ncbi:MAG: D-alanyl-D-alanine carboxypeptidase family protein [Ruminococcus sp.]|jgi:D-alanyl-D-alanine dipeptidase/carboxypeptidase
MKKVTLTEKDSSRGELILVSPGFPLRGYPDRKDLISALEGEREILMNLKAGIFLKKLMKSLYCEDLITAVSGFRTQREQEEIWETSLKENGRGFTRRYVALPGHSEHQTGLAVDLAENRQPIDEICPSFPAGGICGRFRRKAPEFGFVERYPEGKEPVTGIGAEPWHFRYVGYPHSMIMTEKDMTLEEYISFLKRFSNQKNPFCWRKDGAVTEIFYLAVREDREIELPEDKVCDISGTNEGGMIISVWRKEDGREAV